MVHEVCHFIDLKYAFHLSHQPSFSVAHKLDSQAIKRSQARLSEHVLTIEHGGTHKDAEDAQQEMFAEACSSFLGTDPKVSLAPARVFPRSHAEVHKVMERAENFYRDVKYSFTLHLPLENRTEIISNQNGTVTSRQHPAP